MPILSVCCPQGRRSCKYRGFTQKKEFYASVRSWEKKDTINKVNRYRFTFVKYISPISVGGATEKQIRSNKKQFQLPRGTKI